MGSNYFFSEYKDFKSTDIDKIDIIETNEFKEKRVIRGQGKDYFYLKKKPKDELIQDALKSELAMVVGKFLVPEFNKKIGFTIEDLPKVFLNKLKKANPSLYKKLTREDSKGYSWDVAKTPVGVWLNFRRSDYFEKWVSPNRYDFLYREYDGQLMISGETKQYKDLCKKMGKDDADFTMSDLKGKFKVEKGIYAGDKDTLTYVNTIYILLPYDCLTESYIDKLIATIKY